MPAPWPRTSDELRDAACYFAVDRVSGRPEVTEFKRRARWQQAWWRESRGIPQGSHTSGKPPTARPNGSRIDGHYACTTGANFLSPAIRAAVEHRMDNPEPHQTLNKERLWTDLLSSMPMCFNLFGELHADQARLRKAARKVWPSHPGIARQIRFEWSPGRRDPLFLGNRTAFDAAVILELEDGSKGVVGIETKYHEDIRPEEAPDAEKRLPRYREVTEKSRLFKSGWEELVLGSDLQQIWLDHLLVLSMLQHPARSWSWGRFAIVYPAANVSVAEASERYKSLLQHSSSFESRTIEELLDYHVLQQAGTESAFRARYLW